MATAVSHEAEVQKVRAMIKDIKFAMLTTVGEDGALYSRPMATQEVEFDGDLWFFTNDASPKADELTKNRNVNIAYVDPTNSRYVSISGKAALIHDKEKAEELWKPTYLAWFPKGLNDPHLALLKVRALSVEYWDSATGPVQKVIGLAKLLLTGEADSGTNEKFTL